MCVLVLVSVPLAVHDVEMVKTSDTLSYRPEERIEGGGGLERMGWVGVGAEFLWDPL